MAATTSPRKTVSIYDYPEHLNPFREEDNHNKIRFWTIGRKLNRSNSINFSGIKDLKNSWAFRSFMRKGKKAQQPQENKSSAQPQANGEPSPIVFRRALQYSSASIGGAGAGSRSTVGSPERYVYGGSVTPLPRSRFQERLRSTSHQEVGSLSATPRMARSEVSGSRLSVESTNPFDEDAPVPPARAARRKKKKAPAPPQLHEPQLTTAEVQMSSPVNELEIIENEDKKPCNDVDIEDINYNVELKITEDDDDAKNKKREEPSESNNVIVTTESNKAVAIEKTIDTDCGEEKSKDQNETILKTKDESLKKSDSEDDILNKVSFPKIDIVKYRRNSSVNEDDIRLRRGNLEDFHALTTKRSKSLTTAMDGSYLAYDINLNESKTKIDSNGNEEPQRVVCKLYTDVSRKQSMDSTEKEFMEIDKATRELEKEISKLNSALNEDDDVVTGNRLSVSNIKRKFENTDAGSPNPIPKPRRSYYDEPTSPGNGNIPS